jgi:hypothetical protein
MSTLTASALLARIQELSDQYDNPDALARDYALEALREGRPLFWTKSKYHNQRALQLHVDALLYGVSVAVAKDPRRGEWLDTLIPLTPAAEAALEQARWFVAGHVEAAE